MSALWELCLHCFICSLKGHLIWYGARLVHVNYLFCATHISASTTVRQQELWIQHYECCTWSMLRVRNPPMNETMKKKETIWNFESIKRYEKGSHQTWSCTYLAQSGASCSFWVLIFSEMQAFSWFFITSTWPFRSVLHHKVRHSSCNPNVHGPWYLIFEARERRLCILSPFRFYTWLGTMNKDQTARPCSPCACEPAVDPENVGQHCTPKSVCKMFRSKSCLRH